VKELSERRVLTVKKIEHLRSRLAAADKLVRHNACVYMTGSFGRGEASGYSDLDLFILGKAKGKLKREGKRTSRLRRLDEIRLMAELIRVTDELRFPPFSGDGRWLVQHSEDDLIQTLGTQHDDVENTFTARLLLLLESRPLLGIRIYDEVISVVVNTYWRDYDDHKADFIPAFLANDILRLWRTLCINYEANPRIVSEDEKAKRRVKNYKLKHSRLLTCYSALLYLLYIHKQNNTVGPTDVLAMIRLTPTQRLEYLSKQRRLSISRAALEKLLSQYDVFLSTTNCKEDVLIEQFKNRAVSKTYMDKANEFGDSMFDALRTIGDGSRFYRLLVV
jgi:predicted nucleotidyltransferase